MWAVSLWAARWGSTGGMTADEADMGQMVPRHSKLEPPWWDGWSPRGHGPGGPRVLCTEGMGWLSWWDFCSWCELGGHGSPRQQTSKCTWTSLLSHYQDAGGNVNKGTYHHLQPQSSSSSLPFGRLSSI